MPKVALAYSGSLDTTLCVHYLRHVKGLKVYTFSANLGQPEYLAPLAERAVELGASAAHLADLREKFVREFVFPAIRAEAVYEQGYYLFSALSRPLIVREVLQIAEDEGCVYLAHGARGLGNDLVRFENAARALAPDMKVLTPLVDLGLRSPADDLDYAKRAGLRFEGETKTVYNVEQNLWGSNVQVGRKDPWEEAPKDTYFMTVPPQEAPARPSVVEIGFRQGEPVSVDGEELPPVRLVETLNEIGGRCAVGRFDVVENRLSGQKTREIYEAPAAVLLITAHRALASLVLEREALRALEDYSRRFADLVYEGNWFHPVRQGLEGFFAKLNEEVTGTVRLTLCRGGVQVSGRKSPHSRLSPPTGRKEGPGFRLAR
jgi:argininosuccinate synthase